MARPSLRALLAVHTWPVTAWLLALGVVLLIRFPLKFLFDPSLFLMDFNVFRTVASRLAEGQAAALYDPVVTDQMMFKYAPCWALAIVPFGWLPGHLGAVVWTSLTVGWLLAASWVSLQLCREAGVRPMGPVAVLAVLVLIRPITSEFLLGQTNLLWGLLVAGAVLLDVRQRRWGAALLIALAISLKLPALIVLPYFMLRRRWGAVGRTLVCFGALNAVAAWALLPSAPIRLVESWARILMASGADRAFEIGNQSLLALAGRFLRDDGLGLNLLTLSDATVTIVAGCALLLLFLALFVPRSFPQAEPARTAMDGALLSVLMVVGSPTCWVATYAALLFPVVLALGRLIEHPRTTWGRPLLAGGALIGTTLSLMTHSKFWRFVNIRQIHGETYVYLVLMVLPFFGLSLAWVLWHQRRALVFHPD